ncbi:MAG: tetratricopeptide repeat protein [Candidatus Omnitrophica bacterium]|nr:tetratricopeptide repeat protein [Candidatus Omnitrophota bacterium]
MAAQQRNKEQTQKGPRRIFQALLVGTFLAYLPSLKAPFQLDSIPLLHNNPLIKNIQDWTIVWNWDPSRFISHMSFALNYVLSQTNPLSYHIVNILMHVIIAFIFYQFLRITLRFKPQQPLIHDQHQNVYVIMATMLYLLHPIQTSTVTYVVQRSTMLATLFYLLTLSAYACFHQKKNWFTYGFALLFAFLGCFTKPIFFTLPISIVFYDLCFISKSKKDFMRRMKTIIPFMFVFILIPLLLTLWRYKYIKFDEYFNMTRESLEVSRRTYLFTQFNVIVTYFRILFMPIRLRLDYDYRIFHSFWTYPTYLCFALITAVIAAGLKTIKKHRLIGYGIGWFFIALSLESTIFPIHDVIFEHRLYLPMIGFSIIFPALILQWQPRQITKIMTVILIICFGMTFYRNIIWSDKIIMIKDTIRKSPTKTRLYALLGVDLILEGRYEEALSSYNKIIALKPDHARGYYERSNMHLIMGRADLALKDINKAIELDPFLIRAYISRQSIYIKQQKFELALVDLETALAINPFNDQTLIARGVYRAVLRDYDQALQDFNTVIELVPYHLVAHLYRAKLFKNHQKYEQALADVNWAIERDPDFLSAYAERSEIYTLQKKYDLALADLNTIIKNNRHHFIAYARRGFIQSLKGDYKDAIKDFNASLSYNPGDQSLYVHRANALREMGYYKDALKDYNQTIENGLLAHEAYAQKAQLYGLRQQWDKALENINEAVRLQPENFMHYYNRSIIHYHMQSYSDSLKDLSKSIAIYPDFPLQYNNRGNVYLQLKQYEKAVADFSKAIDREPDYALAYYNRSIAYKNLKQYGKALLDAQTAQNYDFPIDPMYIQSIPRE